MPTSTILPSPAPLAPLSPPLRDFREPLAAPHADWLALDDESTWLPAAPENAGFICARRPLLKPVENLGLVTPRGVRRWTAIGTFSDPYWNRVRHGTPWADIPEKTQFLLWERAAGGYGILLPLLSGDHVTSLRGDPAGVRLVAVSGDKNHSNAPLAVAYAATGHDLYALVERSVQAIVAQSRSFRLRAQKKVPAFVDHLGWCSWDAFYSTVDERKFLAAMRSFQRGGVTPASSSSTTAGWRTGATCSVASPSTGRNFPAA